VKILLTGRNGQVGWELERALPALGDVTATDRSTLDLADADSIRRVVREAQPDVIVNAAAYTAVDKAESEPELAMRINGIGPGVLAEEADRSDALLVHYSTDYVFDGSARSPYREIDAPNPINVYGRTKLEGERAIQAAGPRHLILRTSWVYGLRGRNFLRTMLARADAGAPLAVVDDQRGSPTWGRHLASATVTLIQRAAELPSAALYHLTAQGETTWFGFAERIFVQLGKQVRIRPISTGEYPTAARRPAYSALDCSAVADAYGMVMSGWEAGLEECLSEL
jgi:dTDP-4-dehydrorhamnose reductase